MQTEMIMLLSIPLPDAMPSNLKHVIRAYRALVDAQHEAIMAWADTLTHSGAAAVEQERRNDVLNVAGTFREWATALYREWERCRA